MKRIIKLEQDGLMGLHFYEEGLNFPVVVAIYYEWQEPQISFLGSNVSNKKYNTEDICRWCISHNIPYQILYPIDKKAIIMHPYKYYKFLWLKRRLRNIQ